MKTLEYFSKQISWNSKFYFLLSVLIVGFGFLFSFGTSSLTLAVLLSLTTLLGIEYFTVLSKLQPKTWSVVKWMLLLITASFILIG